MDFISPLFFGLLFTFIGLLLPGMVNMTAVSISLKYGFRSGMKYSAGALIAGFIQAAIAVTFAGYLGKHPEVIAFLKKAAVVVCLLLSIVYLRIAIRPKPFRTSQRKGMPIMLGFAVNGMNALNIPYFFTTATFLQARGLIRLQAPYHLFFAIGVAISTWGMLAAFARFAQYIEQHASYLARHLNYFISGLFLILAMAQMASAYFKG